MSRIHPAASVDKGAQLGEDVEIGPYCIVGAQVKLGARTRLQSHVNIEGLTEIGEDCVVHPFASLGGVPQHAAHTGEPTRLIIGDRNQIREHVTMNAGSSVGSGVTKVGSDGMFYTGAHVAHDCVVGDRVLLTNLATLGGHVTVEHFANISAGSGVHQFCRVGRYAFIGGYSVVTKDALPYARTVGNRARIYGLNTIGPERRGFTPDVIKKLKRSFRYLLQSKLNTTSALKRMEQDRSLSCPEVQYLIDFIHNSERGVILRRPTRRAEEVLADE